MCCLPAGGEAHPSPRLSARPPARAEGPLPAAPSGRPVPRCPGAPPLAWEGKRRGAEVPVGQRCRRALFGLRREEGRPLAQDEIA